MWIKCLASVDALSTASLNPARASEVSDTGKTVKTAVYNIEVSMPLNKLV